MVKAVAIAVSSASSSCVNGLSVKEIAESENVSVSTVKSWRSGARNKLRDQLLEV